MDKNVVDAVALFVVTLPWNDEQEKVLAALTTGLRLFKSFPAEAERVLADMENGFRQDMTGEQAEVFFLKAAEQFARDVRDGINFDI